MSMGEKLKAPPIEARETRLDKQGDLLVHIANDEENQFFLVDSHALSRVSGKWKPQIQELRDAHDRAQCTKLTISVQGRPDYHWLLFRIMHVDFECIPEELSESQLFDLLSLTEEYQIRLSLLRPWMPMWIQPYKSLVGPGLHDAIRLYNRLWVAWVLGEVKKFHELLIVLVQDVVHGDGDGVLLNNGRSLPRSPEIPGLFSYLRRELESRVSQLLHVFERHLHIRNGPVQYCKFAERPDTERSMCDLIVSGSILRGYNRMVGPTGFDYRYMNVKATYDSLKTIKIYTYSCMPSDGAPAPPACQTHEGLCNPTVVFHEAMGLIMEMKDLDHCFLQHLSRQAKLTGLERSMWD
ncbi:hypothetical protein PG996_004676 [Apiospora saccharicola]|uniref:BTB domain-containing protein n=1 Tax=Apiospora saccharicola TaxID=335842 RepID=A0ABR1W4U9_9PEZI